jgi:glycine/sarcosine N-methyltransferase
MDQFDQDFASHWDELVGWDKRAAADTGFLLGLINQFGCRSVLDVALGTGFHSIKLLSAGLRVKSLDISQSMIDVAKKNAANNGVKLDVACSDWVDMHKAIREKFDCVICLGNSLACEMDTGRRQIAIRNWSNALNEGGVVVVDRRNYEVLLSGERYSGSNGQYFGDSVKIGFNKVIADETEFSYTFADGRSFTLKMYPILDQEIRSMCRSAGLEAVEVYGDRKLGHQGKDVAFYTYVFRKSMKS